TSFIRSSRAADNPPPLLAWYLCLVSRGSTNDDAGVASTEAAIPDDVAAAAPIAADFSSVRRELDNRRIGALDRVLILI
ncbi:MAG: hypothetical protein KY456_15065, partial [Chloroflexi bacterium]|nr:hypothetical protein [Chloroflexota bacterium]